MAPSTASPANAAAPSASDIERAAAFACEPFLLDGEGPEALAPGTARRRALDAALVRRAEREASGSGPEALGLTDAVKFEDVDRVNRGGGMQEANESFAMVAAAAKTAAAALALVKANTAANITGTSGPTI